MGLCLAFYQSFVIERSFLLINANLVWNSLPLSLKKNRIIEVLKISLAYLHCHTLREFKLINRIMYSMYYLSEPYLGPCQDSYNSAFL